MKKELYKQNVKETSISVVQTSVQSVRTKDISKSAIRLYDNQKIGIAGALGNYDDGALTERAKTALDRGLSYPFEPAAGTARSESAKSDLPTVQEFVPEMEGLLAELKDRFPDFLFSNKINFSSSLAALSNDNGLDYSYSAKLIDVGLIVKEKTSANMIDTFVAFQGTTYKRESVIQIADMACGAFRNTIDIDEGRYPVCFFADDRSVQRKLIESLSGLMYGSGGSLFSGKMGEKLFADTFTVVQSRSDEDEIYNPFFDFEGTVNPLNRYTLIENGTVLSPYTNRNYAEKYKLPLTGSAAGAYDSVPDLGAPHLIFGAADRTAAELLNGRKGILVFIASGGDFTPDGTYASPVQVGYLYDGEKLVGKIPEVALSSHLYSMFGADFIGVSADNVFPDMKSNVLIAEMDVKKG